MPPKKKYDDEKMMDSKESKPKSGKKVTVKLEDKETGKKQKVTFKSGGLHESLGVPKDKDLPKGIMEKIIKLGVGKKVKVMGKDIEITDKIRRQAQLGLNLSKKK